jgi:hypothetical protein
LKKIIYLFGAGATHAVINAIDPSKQLLTADIRQQISNKEQKSEIPIQVWNELMDSSVDIEHLISVLETNYNYSIAQKIRGYYHDAIISLSEEIIKNIDSPSYKPNLYSVLFNFHSIKELEEKVTCILTLNYEDILEQTLISHLNFNVDYLIDDKTKKRKRISVLKLHGSFNWINSRPIVVKSAFKIKSEDALWIPPGVEKKKENYPFNVLWGKAFEHLMECNILRVIGCSLSRNDWGLIPMIYTAMRLTGSNRTFEIEIIDFCDKGEKIKEAYPYLNIKSIIDIEDFKKYLKDVYSLATIDAIPQYIKDDFSSNSSKKINIFEWWLRSKGQCLLNKRINIATSKSPVKNYFENFIKQRV